MLKAKRKIILPTPEEDAQIRAGIAADPDARELSPEEIARMRPAREVMPEFVERWKKARAKGEIRVREFVTVEIDLDLAERFGFDSGRKDDGEEWKDRLNDALRTAVFGEGSVAPWKTAKPPAPLCASATFRAPPAEVERLKETKAIH